VFKGFTDSLIRRKHGQRVEKRGYPRWLRAAMLAASAAVMHGAGVLEAAPRKGRVFGKIKNKEG